MAFPPTMNGPEQHLRHQPRDVREWKGPRFCSPDLHHQPRDVGERKVPERQLQSNGTPPRPSRRSASNTRAAKAPARQRAR